MLTVPNEIKELLHRDSCKKNIRIHFPNGERTDICNDLIVKDSVSFTESLCSQDKLKFGLCESPVFECETVGVGNIKGAVIEVSCEIFCPSTVTGAIWQNDLQAYVYQIPYGSFIVNSCDRQADMIHRKIVAYGISAVENWINDSFEWNKINTVLWGASTSYVPDAFLFLYSLLDESVANTNLFDIVNEVTPSSETSIVKSTYTPGSQPPSDATIAGFTGYEIEIPENIDMVYIDGIQEHHSNLMSAYANSGMDCSNFFVGISAKKTRIQTTYGSSYAVFDQLNELLATQGGKSLPFHIYPRINGSSNGVWLYIPTKSVIEYYGSIVVRRWSIENISSGITVKMLRVKDEYRSLLGLGMTLPTITTKVKISGTKKTRYKIDTTKIDSRSLLNDFLEQFGLFGYIDRHEMLQIINIKQQFMLTPQFNLYPSDSLYPEGVTGGKILPEDYQNCWYGDEYAKPFGAITVTYTNTSNETCKFTYYISGYDEFTPISEYKVYDMSNNSIINNYKWTETQIETICGNIAANISGVTYMPVEFVGRGLPYVEAGDTFEILTKSNDSITTIVLNRTISGEITLTDTYKST